MKILAFFALSLGLWGQAAPTGVAVSVTGTSATVTWTGANVSNYRVLRAAGACPESTFTTLSATLETNSYTDSTVTAGSSYCYEVENQTGANVSAPTSITAVIPGGTPPPAAHSVTVAWIAPAAITGVTVTGYQVLKGSGACTGTTVLAVVATPTASPYVDTAVTAGLSYCYSVATVAGSAVSAPYSPDVSATVPMTTGAVPLPPSSVTITVQ